MKSFHKCNQDDIDAFNRSIQVAKALGKGTNAYQCSQCPKVFTSKNSIQNHVRREHPELPAALEDPAGISLLGGEDDEHLEVGQPENKKYKICTEDVRPVELPEGVSYKLNRNNQRIRCPHKDCLAKDSREFIDSRMGLCLHLSNDHFTPHKVESESFESTEQFEKWLALRQEETGSSMIMQSKKTEGTRVLSYMICKCEGDYERTGSKRYGHQSNKQTGDLVCSAFVKIHQTNGVIDVDACFYHFGHDVSVPNLNLTTIQKEKVAQLVSQGLSNSAIAKQVKKEFSVDSKLHYLNSDDIRNLKNGMQLCEEKLDSDDLKSVELRIAQRNFADGFRLYVPPTDEKGSDFLLVIITPAQLQSLKNYSHKMIILDDTHNVTQYGLKLTTITVVDNYDRGEPAGFLISSSTTSKEVAKLFECIRELFPEFHPKYCMTDDANCFWNGYTQVFPDNNTQKANILPSVLASLRMLLREPKKDRALHRVMSLLTKLDEEGSEGSKAFADYFRTYYFESATTSAPDFDDAIPIVDAHSSNSSARLVFSETYQLSKSNESETEREEDLTRRMDLLQNVIIHVRSYNNSIKSQSWSLLFGQLRNKRRNSDDLFEASLEAAETALQSLLSNSAIPGLVIRSNSTEQSQSARESMHAKISLKKRSRTKRKTAEAPTTDKLIPKRYITRCSICAETDPPLPSDIDPMEEESVITQWKRCVLCKQAAHLSCTLSVKKCACSEVSKFELYPSNYEEENDSDETEFSD
ncbi:unnamed protein product [Caenorhabditis nigoni]